MSTVQYGPAYIKTPIGMLKILEIICMLLGIILVAVKNLRADYIDAFLAGTIIGVIVSVLILIISVTSVGANMEPVLRYQFVVQFVVFVYLIICAPILTDWTKNWPGSYRVYPAGGAFGVIGAVLYLIDSFLSYKAYV